MLEVTDLGCRVCNLCLRDYKSKVYVQNCYSVTGNYVVSNGRVIIYSKRVPYISLISFKMLIYKSKRINC